MTDVNTRDVKLTGHLRVVPPYIVAYNDGECVYVDDFLLSNFFSRLYSELR